jgi:hypothetical protein
MGARGRKTTAIELRYGQPITGVLTQLYVIEGLSEKEVGRELGLAQSTVHDLLVHHGIPRRQWAFPTRSRRETTPPEEASS